MAREQQTRKDNLTVSFGGQDYEVEVEITETVESWMETHGDPYRHGETMSESYFEGVEIVGGDYPDTKEFIQAVRELVIEQYS